MKPKFSLIKPKREFVASKEFTDREEPRKLFGNAVNELFRSGKVREKRIIVYYGVGGIGKSSLQKEIKKELIDKYPNSLFTSIDFKDAGLHKCARALYELTKQARSVERIKFPHFEMAYTIYFTKRYPDFSYNSKSVPYESEVGLFSSLLSLVDGLGLLSVTSNLISKAYEMGKKWGLNSELKEAFFELEKLNAIEIEERLPAFFAYDFNKFIENNHTRVSVIFIDTYEALFMNAPNKYITNELDGWIRELISHLPNTLFIICGREKLTWGEYETGWNRTIDHHIIENLGEKDTMEFLIKCGIEDEGILKKIYFSSEGHPYYLDLAVDTFVEMKNQNLTITTEHFGTTKKEILDRFLKYLSPEEIETLKVMCVPRFYNRSLFKLLLTKFNTGYSLSRFKEFNNFSFISEEEGTFLIHSLMRESMYEYTDLEYRKEIHQYMVSIYEEKIETSLSIDQQLKYFKEYIYHIQNGFECFELEDYLMTKALPILKAFQMYGEANNLLNLLIKLEEEIHIENMNIELVQIMVDIIHLNGNYEEAAKVINNYLKPYSNEEIINRPSYLKLYIRKIHHEMFFKQVKPLIEELIELESKIKNPEEIPNEYNELLFMIGGNLGVLHAGDWNLCRHYLIKSMRFARKHNNINYLVRTCRKYADVLRVKGHLKWSEILVKEGIRLCNENSLERYGLYLKCTLADIYRVTNRYEEAKELYNIVLNRANQLSIRGWWAHAYLGLAELEFDQDHYEDAINHYEFALQIYRKINQIWGISQCKLGILKCNELKIFKTERVDKESLSHFVRKYDYSREYKMLLTKVTKPYQLMFL